MFKVSPLPEVYLLCIPIDLPHDIANNKKIFRKIPIRESPSAHTRLSGLNFKVPYMLLRLLSAKNFSASLLECPVGPQ